MSQTSLLWPHGKWATGVQRIKTMRNISLLRMLSGLSRPLSTSVKRFCSAGGRAVQGSRKCVIIITQQLPNPRSKPNNYPATPNPLWINYPSQRSHNIHLRQVGGLLWVVVKPSGRKHIIIMAPNYQLPNSKSTSNQLPPQITIITQGWWPSIQQLGWFIAFICVGLTNIPYDQWHLGS